jgi:DNA-binding transcriptional LysR family regulator
MISTRHDVFLIVAQQKSFSKASQVLYITQPAISNHIKSLEKYYKINLFERNGTAIELTAAGKLLFERLMEAKQIQEQTEFEISRIKDVLQAKGELKLGVSSTVALYILPKVLSAFTAQYPNINVTSLNRNSELILEALLNQTINIGIIEGRIKFNQVDFQPFMADKVIAVCSKHSPIAKKRNYQIKDVLTMPLAFRERGSGTLASLKYALEKNKLRLSDLNIKVRLGGTESLKNFIVESDTLGFLPQRSIVKELKYGELCEVNFEGLHIERTFYFIQRKGENSELNKTFIRLAREVYNV